MPITIRLAKTGMVIALYYGIYKGTCRSACNGKRSIMTTTFSRAFIAEQSTFARLEKSEVKKQQPCQTARPKRSKN